MRLAVPYRSAVTGRHLPPLARPAPDPEQELGRRVARHGVRMNDVKRYAADHGLTLRGARDHLAALAQNSAQD